MQDNDNLEDAKLHSDVITALFEANADIMVRKLKTANISNKYCGLQNVKTENRAYMKFTIGEESMDFTYLATETDSTLYHIIKAPESKVSFKVKRVCVEQK
jgi:hypothetical protein